MIVVSTVVKTASGATVKHYLTVAEDGSLVRVDCAINAAMWPGRADLAAWLAGRPTGQRERLQRPDVEIEEVVLNLRGVTAAELAESCRPAAVGVERKPVGATRETKSFI